MTEDDVPEDQLTAAIKRATSQIMEHGADSVQIIATQYLREKGSRLAFRGAGNFYTRRGAVERWLLDDMEADRVRTEIQVREEDAE